MSVALSTSPGAASAEPAYMDQGGILRPIFGGALQKLNRLGDRFAIDVTMPPMRTEALGRTWVADLILAQRQGAIFSWPQPDFVVGSPGSPVVDGASQSGALLDLRGFTAGYQVRKGQFFSIIHSGRRYVHMATAAATAGGGGAIADLPIAPMLRVQPSDGATCEFAVPKIEGLVEGDSRSWTLSTARMTGLSFRILEAK